MLGAVPWLSWPSMLMPLLLRPLALPLRLLLLVVLLSDEPCRFRASPDTLLHTHISRQWQLPVRAGCHIRWWLVILTWCCTAEISRPAAQTGPLPCECRSVVQRVVIAVCRVRHGMPGPLWGLPGC